MNPRFNHFVPARPVHARRQRPARHGYPGNRWGRWAQALFQSRRRWPGEWDVASQLLARTGFRFCVNHTRWLAVSTRVSPQIHLALPPLISESRRFELHPAMVRHFHTREVRRHDDRERVLAEEPATASPGQNPQHPELPVARRAPLEMGGRRLQHRAEVTQVLLRRDVARSETIAERVMRVTRRIESTQGANAAPVIRQTFRPAPARESHSEIANSAWSRAEPAAKAGPRQTPAPKSPPPQRLDIEALTDQVVQQIDRRMTAHRERMGRI